ncbi:MAG: galactitol-1-phosphate 5-dehydrogenase [Candidatus Micrarchaeota archaeon]
MYAERDLRYEQVSRPAVSSGDVLVKVRCAGICSSDIGRYSSGKMVYKFPLIMGHEFSGEVAKIGEGVNSFSIGEKVAIYPLIPCNSCEFCKEGKHQLCEKYNYLGSRTSGGFAEYVKCPVSCLVKVPKEVGLEDAALIEPMAVALHGVRKLKLQAGSSVLVYGMGTVGLFAVQWARIFGAGKIIVVDRNDFKLSVARKVGATHTVNSQSANVLSSVSEITGGRGTDFVVECSGASEFEFQSLLTVRKGGSVVFVGNPKSKLEIPDDILQKNLVRKEVSILGSWNSVVNDDWQMCIDILAQGAIDCKSLVTHHFQLKDISKVFSDITEKKMEFIKVVFTSD